MNREFLNPSGASKCVVELRKQRILRRLMYTLSAATQIACAMAQGEAMYCPLPFAKAERCLSIPHAESTPLYSLGVCVSLPFIRNWCCVGFSYLARKNGCTAENS